MRIFHHEFLSRIFLKNVTIGNFQNCHIRAAGHVTSHTTRDSESRSSERRVKTHSHVLMMSIVKDTSWIYWIPAPRTPLQMNFMIEKYKLVPVEAHSKITQKAAEKY